MTSSACSSAITRALSELSGVSRVLVDILGQSANVVVDQRDLVAYVTEAIEDCGFDADIVSVEPIQQVTFASELNGLRTASLRVDGVFVVSSRHNQLTFTYSKGL
jgi:Cu+-exporting ATPase